MKRPGYREAVRWIAHNDNGGGGDSEVWVARYITSALVADLFGVEQERVAADVVRERRKAGLPVGEGDE